VPEMSANCRANAAKILARVIAEGASLDQVLSPGLEAVATVDRALLQQLCYGTLRSYHRLDGVLSQLLKKPLKKKDADLRALMLCGLHQLLEMRTPPHAAISETVEACRALKKNWATGLVNGVLRRCSRESEALLSKLSTAQQSSHPGWLFDAISRHWPAQAQQVLAAGNGHPPMCLRVNRRLLGRDEYLLQLQAAGIDASSCVYAEDGIRLQAPVDVERLPGFGEGLVSVQDEAAQLAADLMSIGEGDRVLDSCCAPGGKACHLLERQPAIAELVAMDSDSARLDRVVENLSRLGLAANVMQGDATTPPRELEAESFDQLLVDAPCSGSGVIRRHPDIKLLRRAEDIPAFATTQLAILQGLWPLLKPGGQLLYATCSILPEENSGVIGAFLAGCDSAKLLPLAVDWGIECDGGRQLLPSVDGADGLFYALLQKTGAAG
jgi:16S rRNA (cytosine967-C5)-methyltransferase